MVVEIDIDAGLDGPWRERMSRQINFKFASAAASVRLLTARLKVASDGGSPLYVCEMEGRLRNGERRTVETQGSHPNICIADAAARLARSIRRDQLFSPVGQAVR